MEWMPHYKIFLLCRVDKMYRNVIKWEKHLMEDIKIRKTTIFIYLAMLCLGGSLCFAEAMPNDNKLNAEQRQFAEWTEDHFKDLLDMGRYAKFTQAQMDELEAQCIKDLHSKFYEKQCESVNTLAALGTDKASGPLLELAMDTSNKDNRVRWQAIRAIGMIGNDSQVGSLIHFVYHYNRNVRLWAEISLVRLTGQNFGSDWHAWGKWWQQQRGPNAFNAAQIQWTSDNSTKPNIAPAAGSINMIVQENVGLGDVKLNDARTNKASVRRILGEPESISKTSGDFELWSYREKYGIELGTASDQIKDIRLLENFGGKLSSGITLNSTMDEVYSVYGQPLGTRKVKTLSGGVPDKVYCTKGTDGKLRYYSQGITFWTNDNKIAWIHVSKL